MGLIGTTLRIVGQLLPILDTYSEATIGPEGGTLAIAGGHSLYFPPGALPDTLTVSAVRDPLKILVDFAPHGLVFPDSAQPQLTYSYEGGILLGLLSPLLGGLIDPSDLLVVYLNGRLVADILPTTVDEDAKVATANLSHFSTYALATD
ncbi:MAG: hypothetical protein GEU90_14350 [Gemmatimonas sp.]|nr:hypothetical protein [Gemmatimonas sp.]